MLDTVINGTRTSRSILGNLSIPDDPAEAIALLKSTGWPIDLGPLNDAGLSQRGTDLNKASLLTDETAALYKDLPENPAPNDVLAQIGEYNTYWWGRREVLYSKIIKRMTPTSYINLVYWNNNQSTDLRTKEIPYSSTAVINENGQIKLSGDISTVTVSATPGLHGPNKNCYFIVNGIVYYGNLYNIIYGSESYTTSTSYYARLGPSEYSDLIVEDYASGYGELEFLHSENRNEYQDSGILDGYEYEYFGIPFINAITAPKITSGSYVGTGTYGSGYPNSLTFEANPKIVFIYGPLISVHAIIFTGTIYALTIYSGNSSLLNVSWDGKTVKWYSIDASDKQLNSSGYDYKYFAIS